MKALKTMSKHTHGAFKSMHVEMIKCSTVIFIFKLGTMMLSAKEGIIGTVNISQNVTYPRMYFLFLYYFLESNFSKTYD